MRTQLHHILTEAARLRGTSPALSYADVSTTFAELWSMAAGAAAGLRRLGLGRGQRVAVYLDKRVETVAAIFGTSAAGGAIVPVNPLLRPRQVGHILSDSGASILVTSPERLVLLREELDACKSVGHVVLVGQGDVAGPEAHYDVTHWTDLSTSTGPPVVVEAGAIDIDLAAIFYTSGSTGKPKGVVVSHRNLLVGAESVAHYLENSADDVILAALPLSFDAGFSQLTTAFHAGAHVVLLNYLMPQDVVRHCAEFGVTGLTGVPPLWIRLADQAWPADAVRKLRYFANTGGRMPKATLDRLRSILPAAKPYLMYGLTEAFRSTYLDPAEVDRRPDSIGKAIPNAEILVVRPDGSECAPGEHGELVHRGALVSLGYWNDPDRTAERFRPVPGRDGSLPTPELAVWSGDTAVRDEDGFLYFVGRADEMLKISGYRVSPTEIEEVAYSSGLVRDAVAIGVEDPVTGQHVVLFASPPVDAETDRNALLEEFRKQLPLYMVPKRIEIRPELPRSPNGKFDRSRLRGELERA
jgi:acyl-CoA ligase (AMP-forming) (exosortase A-associated)